MAPFWRRPESTLRASAPTGGRVAPGFHAWRMRAASSPRERPASSRACARQAALSSSHPSPPSSAESCTASRRRSSSRSPSVGDPTRGRRRTIAQARPGETCSGSGGRSGWWGWSSVRPRQGRRYYASRRAGVVGEVGPQACEIIGLKSYNSPTTDEGAGAGRGRVFQCCAPDSARSGERFSLR